VSSGPLREAIIGIYVPRYGESWVEDILDAGSLYARIDAQRMFAFHMPPDDPYA
jgi:hypothetical protein